MEETFETQVVVDYNLLKEVRKYLMPTSVKVVYVVLCTILWLVAFLVVLAVSWRFSWIYIFAYILTYHWIFYFSYRRMLKKNSLKILKIYKELYHVDSFTIATSLREDGFFVKNFSDGSEATIYYSDVKKFAETKNYYLFITRLNRLIYVNKKMIESEGKRNTFLSYLRIKRIKK